MKKFLLLASIMYAAGRENEDAGGREVQYTGKPPTAALTFGQKQVGLRFNPAKDTAVFNAVDSCKQSYAVLIDEMDALRTASSDPDIKRNASTAITYLQTAQMWAVKAITWGK